MTTENQELMPRAGTELDVRRDTNLTVSSPFESAASFELAQKMATLLSCSSIVPDIYRQQYPIMSNGSFVRWEENPDAVGNCFIALELANRLHTSPLLVMQQVDMIHGRPSLRGTFLIGLVNGSGLFTELEFECNGADGDDYGYRARATRLSDGKPCIGPWITWKMVKGEGWYEKKGSKWKTMPEQMFPYRAASFWSRIFASHVTLGLYTREESEEIANLPADDSGNRAVELERRLEQHTGGNGEPKDPPAAQSKPPRASRGQRAKREAAQDPPSESPEESPKDSHDESPSDASTPAPEASPDEPQDDAGTSAGAEPLTLE